MAPATDAQIRLAEQIAKRLPEVSRNEWMRWMQLAFKYGMQKAIHYAERLSADVTMRPAIRRANRLIAQAMRGQMSTLERLPPEECQAILGYVGWYLKVRALRGSLRSEKR